MKTKNQNANNMETTIKNAKFKVARWHSNGLGKISGESANIDELKDIFGDKIIGYVKKWFVGEAFEELYEEEYLVIRTTTDGGLLIAFRPRYRAGGYDDDSVYRFDDDVYEITLAE